MYSNSFLNKIVDSYYNVYRQETMELGRTGPVRCYVFTDEGKLFASQLLREGIPHSKLFVHLEEGVHYKIKVEPFRPTPEGELTLKQKRNKGLKRLFLRH